MEHETCFKSTINNSTYDKQNGKADLCNNILVFKSLSRCLKVRLSSFLLVLEN